jgi:SAM-dependent methyltransferase
LTVVEGDAAVVPLEGEFDRILLSLVIDHIEEPRPLLKRLSGCISDSGLLIAVVPHPFKDSGWWEKSKIGSAWQFGRFVVKNYFKEGYIEKTREDGSGHTKILGFKSHKRTLETYFQMFSESGFMVTKLLEPKPSSDAHTHAANWDKCSRMPYFLVFCCARER